MPLFLLGILSSAKGIAGAAITFISKPPGSWIAAAIAACLGLWWFGQHEFNAGKLACETSHAEAATQEKARQISAIDAANTASNLRTEESEKHTVEIQKVIVHVKDQAAAMPTASDECVPADIADSLRSIR